VPEWTEYDEEIAALARRRREERVERNTKSRRFEEAVETGSGRDEL
jgi:UDP-glucose:glycoprotein glucosyltransferase